MSGQHTLSDCNARFHAGTKRVKYLEENVASLDVKLSKAEVEQLGNVISKDEVTRGHPWAPQSSYCIAATQ